MKLAKGMGSVCVLLVALCALVVILIWIVKGNTDAINRNSQVIQDALKVIKKSPFGE